jgi:hypothetical protein
MQPEGVAAFALDSIERGRRALSLSSELGVHRNRFHR